MNLLHVIDTGISIAINSTTPLISITTSPNSSLCTIPINCLPIRNQKKLPRLPHLHIKRAIQSKIPLPLKLNDTSHRQRLHVHVARRGDRGYTVVVDEVSDVVAFFEFIFCDEVVEGC